MDICSKTNALVIMDDVDIPKMLIYRLHCGKVLQPLWAEWPVPTGDVINQIKIGINSECIAVGDSGCIYIISLQALVDDRESSLPIQLVPQQIYRASASTWGIAIAPPPSSTSSSSTIHFATSANSHSISLWSSMPPEEVREEEASQTGASLTATELHGHTHNIPALAFSPLGQYLASVSIDTTARLWEVGRMDMGSGSCLAEAVVSPFWNWACCFVPLHSIQSVPKSSKAWRLLYYQALDATEDQSRIHSAQPSPPASDQDEGESSLYDSFGDDDEEGEDVYDLIEDEINNSNGIRMSGVDDNNMYEQETFTLPVEIESSSNDDDDIYWEDNEVIDAINVIGADTEVMEQADPQVLEASREQVVWRMQPAAAASGEADRMGRIIEADIKASNHNDSGKMQNDDKDEDQRLSQNSERLDELLLLVGTTTHLYLLELPSMQPLVELPFAYNTHALLSRQLIPHVGRLSFLEYVPELSLVIAVSQAAHAALLIRVLSGVMHDKISLIRENILPPMEEHTSATICGMKVTRECIENTLYPGLFFVRLYLAFTDGKMCCYVIRRHEDDRWMDFCAHPL